MRIKFLSDQVYDTGAPGQGPRFKTGQVVAASDVAKILGMTEAGEAYVEAWLRRWVSRNVAVYVTAAAEPAPVKMPAPVMAGPDFDAMSFDDLKSYADEHDIEADRRSRSKLLEAIKASLQ